MQIYLGSAYVNDFNLFGRTWRVYAQADGDFRGKVEDIANLKTRNDRGEMVPIGSMVKFSQTYGPDPVLRYNGYPAADFMGEADPADVLVGTGDGQYSRDRREGAAQRHDHRMDRPKLSRKPRKARRRCWCSRWPSCWPSSCSPHCTSPGPCRWR
jgi:hypothetical protein